MRKYISWFFSAIIVLCSCNDNTPDGVIEKDKMVNLLLDVHIADGSMFNVSSLPDSAYKYGTGRYLAVFKKHHTDSAQFNHSLKYYSANPDDLIIMYDSIGKILQRKTDSLNKIMVKEQTKKMNQGSKKMIRGMGALDNGAAVSKQGASKAIQNTKADSLTKKRRLDSLKAKMKQKADSIRNKQKLNSQKSKRIKGQRVQ
ncbi:hypothetical protein DJ568_03330 [Mucilaginibacter hurinus]|uniref:DUF4296 domain-containing protein n=1 Tax=Mucilaginibacter hurinus TaxID=2201324 RepID=A0A367GSQ4_9SPHI|nr:DUF4296 domain-containing protein [Mucilaginibacter hurinus]RCH55801.1 hypothetical protein DJ568_03330 [Mucilaginibacter hurinus]